ncbi:TIR domain-containing protein [Hylemonella sp. W303a]|uniref:TIR domain-containing protein n=1 Tax=Hylemonella sp. W303a TaxID=3389873 RepID=UPI00396B0371
MATRKPTPKPVVGAPEIAPADAIRLLNQQIQRAEELLSNRPVKSDALSGWELLTKNFLTKAFGNFSPNVSAVIDIGKYGSFPMNAGPDWWENHNAKSLQSKISRLRGLVELLETELALTGVSPQLEAPQRHLEALQTPSRRVFLVHGHNDGLLHEVARYLEKLQLQPIVLREQPSSGRTIIEKFVDFADVGYAVVLLTPDDRGGTMKASFEEQLPRARQNVILELGYFLGKLSRNRVTALHMGGVEIPSDYSGVAFVAVDDRGAWRLELARELKASGIDIDMNLAL